ncbi:zinc finger, c3HC4 type (RING finger) domain-containing protein [Ditylenchus destructor]|uniref:Zinc finger, c3HC4 type (RING finger) domain-containing protein n=1 Tax=Ditylenchus destructor TaxID=166010 RepID=A0AAD4MHG3_9BILA|nr:zinc finger, c3HC4 type (RING finger) domain-containing protein [Ditylenchus destructor]
MAPTTCTLYNCIICSELFQEGASSLSCGHVYHSACIRDWLKVKRQCPICKKGVTLQGLRKLYFSQEAGACQCSTAIIQAQRTEIESLRQILDKLLRNQTEIAILTPGNCITM